MNIWKIVIATVVIFATGVVTGGLLASHAQRINARQMRRLTNALEAWRAHPADMLRTARGELRPLVDEQRRQFLRTIQRELNLRPEQRARIEQIIREGQEKTREILNTIRPELREHWRQLNNKIRAELTPPQRKRFDELLRERPWGRTEPGAGFGPPPAGRPPLLEPERPKPRVPERPPEDIPPTQPNQPPKQD